MELTLPQNLLDNHTSKTPHKFVILDYNSQDNLSDYLLQYYQKDIVSGKLAVYSFPTAGKFHMAHAKNMAHRCGLLEGGDILVNLDADNFTGPGFVDYIAQQFQTQEPMFLWSRMVKEPECCPNCNGVERRVCATCRGTGFVGRLPRGISGRIAVTANAFLKSGGYNEQFNTWSPDDADFNFRLRRLGYAPKEIDRRYLNAITHPDKMRFREYPHAQQAAAGEDLTVEAVSEADTTIANFGDIGCGEVFKNFNFNSPIQLKPVPTRIFGIGMHKTATTSLHTALGILGFESGHWRSAHWAKAIWEEMMTAGRSMTVERDYALSDLPIPILFQQLDKGYPGSKFILTVRSESSWLRSIRNHWNPEYNKFRHTWNTDPFSHKVHKLVYGQKGFNEEIFLARYKRHNAEVKDYFKNRPSDLLIMDTEAGAGWKELCRFLNCGVPSVQYPTRFVTPTAGHGEGI